MNGAVALNNSVKYIVKGNSKSLNLKGIFQARDSSELMYRKIM